MAKTKATKAKTTQDNKTKVVGVTPQPQAPTAKETTAKTATAKPKKEDLVKAYETIVAYLTSNTKQADSLANFYGTPERAAKALVEMAQSDDAINKELKHILSKAFPIERGEMDSAELIVQGPIRVSSMCPHHLMPVKYEAFLGYIPARKGSVLGISKLSRITEVLARRPILQERLAVDIADALHKRQDTKQVFHSIESEGSAVMLIGSHTCQACRGVESNAKTATMIVRGCFSGTDLEQKFYQAIANIRRAQPFE